MCLFFLLISDLVFLQGHFNEPRLGYLRTEFDGFGVTETHILAIGLCLLRVIYMDVFKIEIFKKVSIGEGLIWVFMIAIFKVLF